MCHKQQAPLEGGLGVAEAGVDEEREGCEGKTVGEITKRDGASARREDHGKRKEWATKGERATKGEWARGIIRSKSGLQA